MVIFHIILLFFNHFQRSPIYVIADVFNVKVVWLFFLRNKSKPLLAIVVETLSYQDINLAK